MKVSDKDRKSITMKLAFLALKEAEKMRLLVEDWEAYKRAGINDIPIEKYERAREDAKKEIKELEERFK